MEAKKPEPIDFQKIAMLLWSKRKFLFKVCAIVCACTIVYVLSVPRSYTAKVTLAPEGGMNSAAMGVMGSLSSLMGGGLGFAQEDAIYPEIYPELIESKQFLVDMFDCRVVSADHKIDTTLYYYQLKLQDKAWWMYPVVWVKRMLPKKSQQKIAIDGDGENEMPMWLTKEEDDVCEAIKNKINSVVDKKTGVISLSYTAQDPLIATIVVDRLKDKLQEHIIDYRTCKTRNDLEYCEKLAADTRDEYIRKQQEYADFCDKHVNAQLQSFVIKRQRLENEVALAQTLYSQASQQLQLTQARLQENTPAFAVLSCASVPLKPSAPKRMIIVIAMAVLSLAAASLYVYMKDFLKEQDKK